MNRFNQMLRCGIASQLALAALLLALLACADERPAMADSSPASRPNVVLILADDLGWTDLGCYGSDFYETPRIDQLAAEGMKFTQNYSACTVCSPTRAALLTGKYPARLHITDWIPGAMPDNPKLLVPDWTKYLPHHETTLAERFRDAGYRTASIGKWHLGEAAYFPETQGFGLNIAGTDKPGPPSYHAPWKIPTIREGQPGEYITDRLADEAVQFIQQSKDKPFFLYLPHFAVHTPIQGRADLVKKYRQKRDPQRRHRNVQYAAMVESLDAAVGRVLDALTETGLAEKTIVVFTSDNGGRITQGTTDNSPLRYGKASAYEGGVRVPLIIRWLEVIKPGSLSQEPVITMDLYPTLLEMTGLEPKPQSAGSQATATPQGTAASPAVEPTADGSGQVVQAGIDGISLRELLFQTGSLPRRDLFWHYPHHQHYQLGGTMPYAAIRSGDYKLIEFFNDMHVELYDLANDIGEQHDLAADQPAKASELRQRLHTWRQEVGAQMPTPNPQFDPSKPEYNPPPKK